LLHMGRFWFLAAHSFPVLSEGEGYQTLHSHRARSLCIPNGTTLAVIHQSDLKEWKHESQGRSYPIHTGQVIAMQAT
jgi:hypothetical protein